MSAGPHCRWHRRTKRRHPFYHKLIDSRSKGRSKLTSAPTPLLLRPLQVNGNYLAHERLAIIDPASGHQVGLAPLGEEGGGQGRHARRRPGCLRGSSFSKLLAGEPLGRTRRLSVVPCSRSDLSIFPRLAPPVIAAAALLPPPCAAHP